MAVIEVLNPVAELRKSRVLAAPRIDSLEGRTIGLFWNAKVGGDIALTAISEELARRHSRTDFRRYIGSVGSSVRMATPEDLEKMAQECDAIIATTSD